MNHVTQYRCALEVHFLGHPRHFLAQFVKCLTLALAFEQSAYFIDARPIILSRDPPDAGRGAIANDIGIAVLVFQLSRIVRTANAQAELSIQPLHRGSQGIRVRKGAEVAGLVVFFQPRHHQSRPGIEQIDLHEVKILIIPKTHIVAWSVVFDQFPLKNQRLLFIAHHMELEIPDRLDQGARFHICTHFSRCHEITRHPLT